MIYESFKQKEIKEEFQKVTGFYNVRGSSAFFKMSDPVLVFRRCKVDDPKYFSNENEMINYIYKGN